MKLINNRICLPYEDHIIVEVVAPSAIRVRDDNGRELDVGLEEIEPLALVNATQAEADAGEGGLRIVATDDPRHPAHTRYARGESEEIPEA